MKKILIALSLLSTFTCVQSQTTKKSTTSKTQKTKKSATQSKPPQKKIPLTDTVFTDLGFKFGYPTGYTASGSLTPGTLAFYNADSSIILAIRITGTVLNTIGTGMTVEQKTAAPDHWYKKIGYKPGTHELSKKPVYVSSYLYPFNMSGADFFWITLLTTKVGTGYTEMQAVKESLSLTGSQPVETREIIPSVATMDIPVYYGTGTSESLVTYQTSTREILGYKCVTDGPNSSKAASDDLKATGVANGFTVREEINYTTPSGIKCVGFNGRLSNKNRKYQSAQVFFEHPSGACYGITLRVLQGFSLDTRKDLEAMLATLKFVNH